ncbi:MAG: outer membrane protein transport protein [Verrucomicrobiales bacterium]|nr:outer membrane protein transport protein [Verrucomicrobiales bacterium]MCP5525875.1 outer membrane protein transport protein [Verrucomicrobiales bacterium]
MKKNLLPPPVGAALWLLAGTMPIDAIAQSGGLFLPENGGPSNGTAQAGSAALARDAETAWLNPAGMTRLESPEAVISLMPFRLGFQFNPSAATTINGSNGADQGDWGPAAATFIAVPVSERVALGFSLTSPAGLIIDPADDWVGGSWTTKSSLMAVNLEPSVGVRLNDQWSIGAGLDVQYLTFEQELRVPLVGQIVGIDGDSWNVGASVGLLWEPLETTRLGLRYRSPVEHELSGDLTLIGTRQVSTSFLMPMSATLSGYHELSDRVALLADVGWSNWQAFDRNVLTLDNSGLTTELARNYQDVCNFALGAHFRPAARWLLMVGAGYTSSAVADADRTPDLPADQQVRGSVGVEYEINARWRIGANYTYLWLGENQIDQTRVLGARLAGDYDAFAHIIGAYGSVRF